MINITKWFKHAMLASIVCIVPIKSIAATSFLESDKPFIIIEDEHDRTQAWGTCVAAYKLMSMIQAEASPATAKAMSDKANGATIALYIDYIMGMDTNASSDQFSARVKMANVLKEGIPESQLTSMLAAGEQLKHNDEWFLLVTNTLNLCMDNIDTQQELINVWREMYASGAFE
jgi:hypothetical protein